MTNSELRDTIFIGIIEDNQDPKKLGRCRVRVLNVFDEIPTEDIPWASPWKDLNGNTALIPDKGKVVSVVFDEGNVYKPEYIFAEHYNINLEKKLQSLSDSDYLSMKAIMFDHKTQIYSNESEGLKIDYKFNNINVKESSIDLNLKDNFGKVNIGTSTANQQAILGNHFLNWFDEFVDNLLGSGGGPYLGNMGAPVLANPTFINTLLKYKALKDPKFLSHNVNLVDNNYVNKQERDANGQIGDSWKSTVSENEVIVKEPIAFNPKDGNASDTPDGTLTTALDSNNNPIVPPEGDSGPPPPVTPSRNPDVNTILETMKAKKYKIYTRPYEMNIVGIRTRYEGMKYTNAFDDSMYLIYKTSANSDWTIHKYKVSTMPGFYLGEDGDPPKGGEYSFYVNGRKKSNGVIAKGDKNNKQSKRFINRNGLGMLAPSQCVDSYYISNWLGRPAMKTMGAPGASGNDSPIKKTALQPCFRDKSAGNTITYSVKTVGTCYYIHTGAPGGINVNNYSEGCQVFASNTELEHYIKTCTEHRNRYGNIFTYTLIEERDLV